ncbi:MAG TPA: type I-E CRISPR-associated protein Cas6/Cse3/CasE [Thermomicrobiales bacterium]|jgi:CRISPR system Cascade subunit CasE
MIEAATTLYLSRLYLDARERSVRRALADCQALHQTLCSALPQAPIDGSGARAMFGLLYRVEAATEAGSVPLLVQSSVIPDWSCLPPEYLLPDWDGAGGYAVRPLDSFYTRLCDGLALRFRLRANPTRRVATPGDPLFGKRVELQREEDQLAWLARKGETGGFRLLDVHATAGIADVRASHGVNVIGNRPKEQEGRKRMTFGSVLFEGRLAIDDTGKFRETLATGIGSAKAYGFGLLSIAPA